MGSDKLITFPNGRKAVQLTCTECQTIFLRKIKEHNVAVKRNVQPFCSRKCSTIYKNKLRGHGQLVLICAECCSTFTRDESRVSRRRKVGAKHQFCCNECATKFNSRGKHLGTAIIICPECGVEFQRAIKDINTSRNKGCRRSYCSLTCAIRYRTKDCSVYQEYLRKVRNITSSNYRKLAGMINPHGLPVGKLQYHVDHKTTIFEAYQRGWLPERTAAPENLQILWWQDNLRKGKGGGIPTPNGN